MTVESRAAKHEYHLDTASHLGRKQVSYLEELLDARTTAYLDEIGIEAGQRCLELGAGGGSITRWLAERTGPTGTVVSVDLDVDYVTAEPGVDVHRHDINDGLPVAGPFDLIHARLLLMHLPRRVEILRTLVDALAPGGWLVIGDFSDRPRRVLSAPTPADERVFDRVQHVAHTFLAREVGVSMTWAHEVDQHMADAGLTDISGQEYSRTVAGGTTGCLLHRNYVLQLHERLISGGITEDELARYRTLMLEPRFRAWFYQFVCTWGRKPRKARRRR
ncbi:methyltransferase family protein [Herbihabitans rhizosphaerae]|uniref:Methyltransferase family protein n=1 Tax=Herbihabitans rhizosphaerae TaxID=1872711 RepID=A0A4Q7KTB9_9PSEU|nr:class I SAM-dependent methyltransferase [Herbihabitans rhizosphaerae]RZS39051.1 methyltransferase family protein [Herbihabitans rhizosphaerae]